MRGFGTFDELFEALVLDQTGKIDHFPVILFGSGYWAPLVAWMRDTVLAHGMISVDDLKLFRVTDDLEDVVAWIDESFVEADEAMRAAEESPAGPERAQAAQERRDQRTTHPE